MLVINVCCCQRISMGNKASVMCHVLYLISLNLKLYEKYLSVFAFFISGICFYNIKTAQVLYVSVLALFADMLQGTHCRP